MRANQLMNKKSNMMSLKQKKFTQITKDMLTIKFHLNKARLLSACLIFIRSGMVREEQLSHKYN